LKISRLLHEKLRESEVAYEWIPLFLYLGTVMAVVSTGEAATSATRPRRARRRIEEKGEEEEERSKNRRLITTTGGSVCLLHH
jgi:hypothetical protein